MEGGLDEMKAHTFYHQFLDGSWGTARRVLGPDNRWHTKVVERPSNDAEVSGEFREWMRYMMRTTAPHTGKAYFELPGLH
jgi:hypothetical protein